MAVVKWLSYANPDPVEVEVMALDDLNAIVASCRNRLAVMRRHPGSNPPDGFIVSSSDGYEVREWFEPLRKIDRAGRSG